MHGRLRARGQWWSSWCRSNFVNSVIRRGYQLPWDGLPPPPLAKTNHPGCKRHKTFVGNAIKELLATGAAVRCPVGVVPMCCSPLNVVEQRDKNRLILDLRHVNTHLRVPAFRYEGLQKAAELVCAQDWLFTLDLKSGYHHVDICPSDWTYLGFMFDERYYLFRSLPFGLATAPYVFTQVIKQLVQRWRAQGMRVVPYVDDILFMSRSIDEAHSSQRIVLADLQASGFILNVKKSQLEPRHYVRFLGLDIDSRTMTFRVPEDRVHNLKEALANTVHSNFATSRSMARIAGMIASMRLALGPASRCLSHGLITFINEGSSWSERRPLTAGARRDISFWEKNISTMNGWPIMKAHTFSAVLSCDASETGWGATLHLIPDQSLQAAALIPANWRGSSSTHRELAGILWALTHFSPLIARRHVLVRTDNQAAAFILTKGGSRRETLTILCLRVLQVALTNNLHISISWVPREHNSEADALSKEEDRDDFHLAPKIFSLIDSRWGPHTIDLFATPASAHLPRFCSRLYEPAAEATNAFSISWKDENAYAFPPPHLIPATLNHAGVCGAQLTLIVPQWSSSYWWPLIAPTGRAWHERVRDVVRLPMGSDCLICSRSSDFSGRGVPNSPMWALRLSFPSR